jgi:hypothetical protein
VLEPGLYLTPVLVVHRFDVAHRGEEIGYLSRSPASGALGADVLLGRAPRPVLDLRDLGEMPAHYRSQGPPCQVRVLGTC